MNTAQLRKVIQAKIAALQTDLAALDRIDAAHGEDKKPIRRSQKIAAPAAPSGALDVDFDFIPDSSFTLARAAREAMGTYSVGESFTKADVLARIRAANPTATVNEMSLASILSKMGKSGHLIVAEKGKGKTPHRYARPMPTKHEFARDAVSAAAKSG